MSWSDALRVAWSGMWGSKLRSLLTMLGVIIGVAAVIVLVAIGNGASQAVSSRIETLGSNLLFVTPGGGTTFTASQVAAIQHELPMTALVVPELNSGGKVSSGTTVGPAALTGTTPQYPALGGISIAYGSFLTAQNLTALQHVAVLGANQALTLFNGSNPVGEHITILGQTFRVIGVLNPVGQGPGASQDNTIFIPLPVAEFLVGSDSLSNIVVKTSSPTAASLADSLLTNLYTNQYGANAVTVASEDQVLSALSATHATFTDLLAGTAAISLLVGGIGIMNIMLVSVTERTREIGIRRALGATREDIVLQFLLESMTISLTGGLIGIALGFGLMRLSPLILKSPAVFSPDSVVLAFVFSTAVGLGFGLYPAIKASRLDPIDALRYSG
ncbi:MAG: ABC transporter permease [Thermaerobacter sp.]|nr:ABC transporter permease [Thermaerobacter sp.]